MSGGCSPYSQVSLLGTSALRARSTLFRPMCLFSGNTRACTQSAHWRTKDRMALELTIGFPDDVCLANDVLCTSVTFQTNTRFWSSTPR